MSQIVNAGFYGALEDVSHIKCQQNAGLLCDRVNTKAKPSLLAHHSGPRNPQLRNMPKLALALFVFAAIIEVECFGREELGSGNDKVRNVQKT